MWTLGVTTEVRIGGGFGQDDTPNSAQLVQLAFSVTFLTDLIPGSELRICCNSQGGNQVFYFDLQPGFR